MKDFSVFIHSGFFFLRGGFRSRLISKKSNGSIYLFCPSQILRYRKAGPALQASARRTANHFAAKSLALYSPFRCAMVQPRVKAQN